MGDEFDPANLKIETAPDFVTPNHEESENDSVVSIEDHKRNRKTKARKTIPPKPRNGTLVRPFTQFYVSIGALISPFDPVCGAAIINQSEECAKALENLAQSDPRVRAILMSLVETSAWGYVIAAHTPILLAIAVHHVPRVRESFEVMSGNAEVIPNDET